MYGSWICPKGKRSRPAQYIFPRGLRQMLGLVISTKTWAHVQLLSNDSSIQFRDVSPHTCSFPAAFFWSRARFSFSSPFRIQRERERERHGGDGCGRAAEGERTRRRRLPLQLASSRPVAPQIREFASSSHTLQFTSHGLRIQDCVLFRENLDAFAPH